jgi:hypothetical protein
MFVCFVNIYENKDHTVLQLMTPTYHIALNMHKVP